MYVICGDQCNATIICNHCPPPRLREMAGKIFSPRSRDKSPALRGPLEKHALVIALSESNLLPGYICAMWQARHCWGTRKVTAPHISPAIPVVGGSGYKWLVHKCKTNKIRILDLNIFTGIKRHCAKWNPFVSIAKWYTFRKNLFEL